MNDTARLKFRYAVGKIMEKRTYTEIRFFTLYQYRLTVIIFSFKLYLWSSRFRCYCVNFITTTEYP
jgi:hypothetical protein